MADISHTYRVGQFTLDLDRQQLQIDGRPITLTRKNFEVLRELVMAEGRIVPRDELTRVVWPDTAVEEATVRQNVYTLRNLLRELDPEREYLETIPKVGYRIAAPVEKLEDFATAPPSPPSPWRLRPLAAAGILILLAGALAVARWTVGASTSATQARSAELVRQAWLIADERRSDLFPAAMALFDDALALDARSADAHAGKALLYTLGGDEKSALAEAARVRELNPVSGVPAAVRGFFQMMYHAQWTEAGRSLAALETQGCPDPFCRQWNALYLGLLGQNDTAVREAAAAVEIFPARLAPRALYGQILYWAGDTATAIRQLQTVLDAGGAATHARWNLWKAQWISGDRRAASESLILALEPSWYRLPPEDEFRALSSRRDLFGTPEFFRRLLAVGPRNKVNPYFLAEIAIAGGDPAAALDHLERAQSEHIFFVPYARRDPLFAPLHNHPRYEAVMKKVGL